MGEIVEGSKLADGLEVNLHVYDLGHITKWTLNKLVSKGDGGNGHEVAAGAFHVGVEVCGVELAFQRFKDQAATDVRSGIRVNQPKVHTCHVYRESVHLG